MNLTQNLDKNKIVNEKTQKKGYQNYALSKNGQINRPKDQRNQNILEKGTYTIGK